MKKVLFAATVISTLVIASASNAVTVTEPPDFPNGQNFTTNPLYALDPGSNTFSGNLAGQCVAVSYSSNAACNEGGGPPDDGQDSFTIEIGPGMQLVSATLQASNVSGPPGFYFSLSFQGEAGPYLNFAYAPSSGTNFLTGPLGPGKYAVVPYAQQALEVGTFNVDYTFTFETTGSSVVPLPASLPLLASGLGGFGLVAWRRKRKRAAATS